MTCFKLRSHLTAALLSLPLLATSLAAQEAVPFGWAYQVLPPGASNLPANKDDGSQRSVPNSSVTMTLSQTRDRFAAPDWHPKDHPPMPEIVLHGRKPGTNACAFCHRAEGQGGAENANISGMEKDYIIRQLKEIRSGARRSAHDERASMVTKLPTAISLTDEEIEIGATYFASLPAKAYLKVVETETVPKTGIYLGLFAAILPGSETEPLGERIVEVPDSADQFELRDTRTTFTAYVPRGSLERGKALAEGCIACHGEGLKGGLGPRLAGQYASYTVRQLYDFKIGKRAGEQAGTMAPVVATLSQGDMIALAAYAASLKP